MEFHTIFCDAVYPNTIHRFPFMYYEKAFLEERKIWLHVIEPLGKLFKYHYLCEVTMQHFGLA